MVSPNNFGKGYVAEELLRAYFLKSGYYVSRGVPFAYKGFDVTDIDLWLYSRASPVSRDIAIVDIKNKKTPQAIERIFWVQGLKHAVGASKAIIATTDRRQEVRDFGHDMNVLVLDGAFISKLGGKEKLNPNRFTEEEFYQLIDAYPFAKFDGDWKLRIRECKSFLAKGLNFDSCNVWLDHARFFVENSISNQLQRETSIRCFYLIVSYFALAVDYLLKDLSFLDQAERNFALQEGFTYGSKGRSGVKNMLELAVGLVEQYSVGGAVAAAQIRSGVDAQLSNMSASVLSEYLSKPEVGRSLFSAARELELLSMQKTFVHHGDASVELRGLLYCLLDFWGIDRTLLSEKQVSLKF